MEPGRTAVTDIDPGAEISVGRFYDVSQDTIGIILWCASRWVSGWIRTGFAGISGSRRARASARGRTISRRGIVKIDVPGYIGPDRIRALLDTPPGPLREAAPAADKHRPMADARQRVRR